MQRGRLLFILIFIGVTLILLPNFYRNRWSTVHSEYYVDWQTRYDRLVVARLVKTRQDGFFSAGGLMGLGDETQMGYQTRTTKHQFNTYFKQGAFQSYYVYRSNPAFQGILYGLADRALPMAGEDKLKLFRAFTAFFSAAVFSLIITVLAVEFGWLAAGLTLLFTILSMWIVLPAGSIFWNFWAFYMPFLASAYLLRDAARQGAYRSAKIHIVLFTAMLVKVLFSGFDLTTTAFVMATVPFVFYAIDQRWELKMFLLRTFKASLALLAATMTGLVILGVQILANEGSVAKAYTYIYQRFASHTGGDYEYFKDVTPRKIHVMEVLPKYLAMPAIDIQLPQLHIQILYWQLILGFVIFSLIMILKYRLQKSKMPRRALALIVTTWYSILAPISWYVTFKPHSFIHTHVNTMGWQMPFTLLGFALCGFVITDLLRAAIHASPSPASQTDLPHRSDTYTPRPRA